MAPLVLAIDPSSKCSGYAFGHRVGMGAEILFAGRCLPRTRANATDRIASTCDFFANLVMSEEPEHIVIESPSGKIHGRFAKTKMSALAIYGMAVGAIWATCRYCRIPPDVPVHLIDANRWTAGKSKDARRIRAKALWEEYCAVDDPGADESDAICLLDWFCRHQELERLKKS